jgi:hypothetical protein
MPFSVKLQQATKSRISMFLLGEMPRDPFGGESRDLEPFGDLEHIWTGNRPRVSHALELSVRTDSSLSL